MTLSRLALAFALAVIAAAGSTAFAAEDERFAVHGQFTYVEQDTDSFNAPYAGPNSLTPDQGRETTDATLFIGTRLWSGGEFWLGPEFDQGFGLDDTLGIAGFPSAEAYKVGKKAPYFRLQHAFIRQTVDTGGAEEDVDADQMALAGSRTTNHWVFTLGKFGVNEIFDTNAYAHDQKNDFLNWVAIDTGSFDYAADAWGFTAGAAAEWYQGAWTLRGGIFDLSNVPNSPHLDPGLHEFQLDGEVERRYEVDGQSGRVLFTVFDSRGRMGLLDQAVQISQATGELPDIAAIRQYRSRLGASVNVSQQITEAIGWFARAGKAAGNVEAYEFTDVDRAVSAGLSIKGGFWRRAEDTVGIAAMSDGISAARERYLDAGGLGILVGDGKLPHPGPEQILETYYRFAPVSYAQLSFDYQWVRNPAYNTDRGPVSIFAVRLHAQF